MVVAVETPRHKFFHKREFGIKNTSGLYAMIKTYKHRVNVSQGDARFLACALFKAPISTIRLSSTNWRYMHNHDVKMSRASKQMVSAIYANVHRLREQIRIKEICTELDEIQRARIVKKWVSKNLAGLTKEYPVNLFYARCILVCSTLGMYPDEVIGTLFDVSRKLHPDDDTQDAVIVVDKASAFAQKNWGLHYTLLDSLMYALDEVDWYSYQERAKKNGRPRPNAYDVGALH